QDLHPATRPRRRPRPPRDLVPAHCRGGGGPARGRAHAAALLPRPGLPPAEGDPPGARLEHPLPPDLSDHPERGVADVRRRPPAPRVAIGVSRRRLGVSLAAAQGPHIQHHGQRRPHGGAPRDEARMSAASRAVAVTGASGFLGRALCVQLAARGFRVRPLVRDPAAFSLPGVAGAARCDLPEVLDESALAGASAIVHCAYATRETDLERAQRVNEDGTRLVLDAARRVGVPRFVLVSTVAAYEGAPSYYARSKWMLERLLDPARDVVIRPGLIVGRGGHGLFQQLLDNMRRLHVVPVFGRGRQPVQTVYLDDLCEAIGRVLERDLDGAFNVAEPVPVTFRDFLRAMAARSGTRCVFVPLPERPVLAAVRMLEALRVPFPLRSEGILGLRGMRTVETADALRRLGMRVRTAGESLAEVFA